MQYKENAMNEPTLVEHLLTLNPRYVVQNEEELSRCNNAFSLLNGCITVFLLVSDNEKSEEEELMPWERYEKRKEEGDENECGPPEELVCTIREHSCDCHGTTYSVRMHAPWPFRFNKTVDNLSIGPGGCRFEVKNTRFHIMVPVPYDDD